MAPTNNDSFIKNHLKDMKVDGVPNIVRASYAVTSIIWSLLLLGNASVCVLLTMHTVELYLHFEVSTNIRYVTEQSSPFPTLLICNVNPFISDYGVSLITQANISQTDLTLMGSVSGNFRTYTLLQAYLNKTRGYLLTDDEKIKLNSLNNQMFSCKFQEQDCDMSLFEYLWHPYYLGCYR